MDLPAFGLHLLNFFAPACFVGWLLALTGLLFSPVANADAARPGRLQRCWRAGWINTLVASLASTAALLLLGHDGEMAGYVALVLAAASSQWVLLRGWRR